MLGRPLFTTTTLASFVIAALAFTFPGTPAAQNPTCTQVVESYATYTSLLVGRVADPVAARYEQHERGNACRTHSPRASQTRATCETVNAAIRGMRVLAVNAMADALNSLDLKCSLGEVKRDVR